MVQTRVLVVLQAALQLTAAQSSPTATSPVPSTTVVPFTSPAALEASIPTSTSSCQCNNEKVPGEIINILKKAVSAAASAFQSGINVFDLSDHINSLQSVFNDLSNISGEIDCISYNSQSEILNLVSQVLEIVHQLLEGFNSFGIVEAISPLVPGLNLIIEGVSSVIVQVGGGLSRQPCCVLWSDVNASSKYINDVNTIIDSINILLPLAKLNHVSRFDSSLSSGQCSTSASA